MRKRSPRCGGAWSARGGTIAAVASRRKGAAKKRSARAAKERPERKQDPRLWATRALAQDGVPFAEETWIVAVSPARLPDGDVLHWHPPMPVAFNLVQAERFRERGVKSRERIMGNLKRRQDGARGPSTSSNTVIDCIFDLQTAVLCSFLAIESLANHAIETLPDRAALTHNKKVYDKDAMVRELSINDKLKKVMPKLDGGQHTSQVTRSSGVATARSRTSAMNWSTSRSEASHPILTSRVPTTA